MKVLVSDQKQTYINFAHIYTKLQFLIFPTIRGKSWFKKVKIDDLRAAYVERQHLCVAKLIYKKLMKIRDVPLEFLEWDVSPYRIRGHRDFAHLLNTFYPRSVYPNLKATLDTEITVLIFEKLVDSSD